MMTSEYRLNDQRIFIASDVDALSQVAVTRLIQHARASILHHGGFYLALSGGSTPVHVHQTLALPRYQQL